MTIHASKGLEFPVVITPYLAWDIEKTQSIWVGLHEDDIDLPFKLPAMLHKAGVRFALQNEGDMERMGTRNLPFYAGTAVAYGLPYEEAVRSLTQTPAKILGIDNRCGTLETGKEATLFISSGDALDMRTNALTHAFIQGRSIVLRSKQTELYEKYKLKYDGKK
jgi:imidazolonepropionase-like amidohydrolase